jgi:hypothetical protein
LAAAAAYLDPILGGPEWEIRLDPNLPRGRAVEKLFRDNLATVGRFDFVVSTKIDRPTADRPHFFIAYGTKSRDGLKVFREAEYICIDLARIGEIEQTWSGSSRKPRDQDTIKLKLN